LPDEAGALLSGVLDSPNPRRPADEILSFLRARGAFRLRSVVLRSNRRTLWSLTRRGSVLNLHEAYAAAPDALLEIFAELVREAPARSQAYARARRSVSEWPGVHEALRAVRWKAPRCAATSAQRVYLQRLYRFLNATRFESRLPPAIPVRLSNRFTRRLGQMVSGREDDRRVVREIALDVDLMLPENDALRLDTMLHEMAHAIHFLVEGGLDHGPRWRWWARRVGCEPRACREASVQRPRRRGARVTRVPALPPGWRARAMGATPASPDLAAGDGGATPASPPQARARTARAASTTASAVSPNSR
jgi:hypothetical protein